MVMTPPVVPAPPVAALLCGGDVAGLHHGEAGDKSETHDGVCRAPVYSVESGGVAGKPSLRRSFSAIAVSSSCDSDDRSKARADSLRSP